MVNKNMLFNLSRTPTHKFKLILTLGIIDELFLDNSV
jgi:hypothetical protein